jgi:thioesterase domain-containing protein/acyl transferase domain-containing protein
MRHAQQPGSDLDALYGAAGRLWLWGHDLDWAALHGSPRRRVSLPTYPFEHRRYWIAPGQVSGVVAQTEPVETAVSGIAESPVRINDPGSWFWRPVWRSTPPPTARPLAAGGRWLLFANGSVVAAALTSQLEVYAQHVITVDIGDRFERRSAERYAVRPGHRGDYEALVEALANSGGVPERLVHMWLPGSLPSVSGAPLAELAFGSLFYLAQALAAATLPPTMTLYIVTDGMERVADEPVGDPLQALVVGPALVIPHELPDVACRLIDLTMSTSAVAPPPVAAAAVLLRELASNLSDTRVALRAGRRWVWDLEPLPNAPSETIDEFPRTGGTYLITGGLSGIGLELAARISEAAPVRLALLSRRALPGRGSWNQVVEEAPDGAEAGIIGKIQRMEAAGARVVVLAADLADYAAVAAAVDQVRRLFGHIDGVLYAAGVTEDAPLQMKGHESVDRVLSPKVRGLLTLETVLSDAPPALLVLFSSTSAFLGLPGQIDYTAANAFLNAFARARSQGSITRTVAVQWGAWRDVGIAARSIAPGARAATARAQGRGSRHPLLGYMVRHDETQAVFEAELAVATHWVVAEHRLVTGEALVPGTAIIELARAAFHEATGADAVEIRHLCFVEPLWVGDDETRSIRTSLRREADGWAVSVESGSGDAWIEHARGTVAPLEHAPPARLDAAGLRRAARADAPESSVRRPALQAAHLDFGPRWRNVVAMDTASGRCVTFCELPKEFRSDLDTFLAHPALLDMALSSGLALLDRRGDLYVPFSYDAIRIYAPIAASLISVISPVGDLSSGAEFIEFNATLSNDSGVVLMEALGFVMRRSTAAIVTSLRQPAPPLRTNPANARLMALVAAGIGTDDGWHALLRVVNRTALSEVVVSSTDVRSLQKWADTSASRPRAIQARASAGNAGISTDDPAATIATMWRDLLGVGDVGLDDDFFELGGHSLVALRLMSQIDKTFGKKLRLAALFEARTVRQLAALVGKPQALAQWLALVKIQPRGEKPPFFCVHAVGGEVLTYAPLGALCAPHQPFIAFRASDHEGQLEPLSTIEEQAALYIREMIAYQPVGPYYIGGYSHGGRVALEMSHQLESAGKTVAFLGIIDTWPQDVPHRSWRYPWRWLRNLVLWAYHDGRQSTIRSNVDGLRRARLTIGRQLAAWGPWARATAGRRPAGRELGEGTNLEGLPESVRRVFELNFTAFRNYRPQGRCGSVTLFRAHIQPIFGPHQPDLGWGNVSRETVHVRTILGSHSSILESPHVGQLAEQLLAALDEAQTRAGGNHHNPSAIPARAVTAVLTTAAS